MLYSCICSCSILGVEGRGAEGREPMIRAEGRGSRNTSTLLLEENSVANCLISEVKWLKILRGTRLF